MGGYSQVVFNRCMSHSKVLSSDVSAAYDPLYASVMEKRNCAYFGNGLVFNKYTGSRGKSGSNDANPEYMAELRKIMDDNGVYCSVTIICLSLTVVWQCSTCMLPGKLSVKQISMKRNLVIQHF